MDKEINDKPPVYAHFRDLKEVDAYLLRRGYETFITIDFEYTWPE